MIAFAVAAIFPILFAGVGVWFVLSDPEVMPMDRFAYSMNFGFLFGLPGLGIGYVVFRMVNDQINVLDGAIGVIFFLSACMMFFVYSLEPTWLTACFAVCGSCLAYFVVRTRFGGATKP